MIHGGLPIRHPYDAGLCAIALLNRVEDPRAHEAPREELFLAQSMRAAYPSEALLHVHCQSHLTLRAG